jgi:catechol 2,3-dioxygenase-like lactoylglutathione lyase family enzyme
MKFQSVVPILYSTDVARSIAYYVGKLGSEEKWEWGTPPTFGGVGKGGVQVFFCREGQGKPGTWLSVFVDNVDEFYKEVHARGAKILSAPMDMEWNVREMVVEDPDGHKIRFGHGIEEK